jgi:hypothetical protein
MRDRSGYSPVRTTDESDIEVVIPVQGEHMSKLIAQNLQRLGRFDIHERKGLDRSSSHRQAAMPPVSCDTAYRHEPQFGPFRGHYVTHPRSGTKPRKRLSEACPEMGAEVENAISTDRAVEPIPGPHRVGHGLFQRFWRLDGIRSLPYTPEPIRGCGNRAY